MVNYIFGDEEQKQTKNFGGECLIKLMNCKHFANKFFANEFFANVHIIAYSFTFTHALNVNKISWFTGNYV